MSSTKSKNVIDVLRYMLQKRIIEKSSIFRCFNTQEDTDTDLPVPFLNLQVQTLLLCLFYIKIKYFLQKALRRLSKLVRQDVSLL
ncbi:hypothetical protein HUN03_00114 [Mycoplasmopsis anatis]|uniref:hypothetical protein n=1 Tax=Mycoplasmopsis anatis TaxID=171279 RepID=UPI003F836EA4